MQRHSLPIQSALVLGALFIAVMSLGVGTFSLSLTHITKALAAPLFSFIEPVSAIEHQVIWNVRLPRILMALLAGSGLALCGATLQGLFRNPLVSPHIIGVSSGAAFGGSLAILLGWSQLGLLASTFSFGMIALLLVFVIAHYFGHHNHLVLILAGVILSGLFGALVSLMQFLADNEEVLPNIVFWLLGSVATANWAHLLTMAVPLLLASILLLALRWRINILSMGEQDAELLDQNAHRVRWLILILCAVIIASQVAVSGNIGWVGLVVPHMARMVVGSDHRALLPASMAIGGAFMVLVDDLARTLTAGEIPLGILTALLGTVLIVCLLYCRRKEVLV